jgi:hypothetical protein
VDRLHEKIKRLKFDVQRVTKERHTLAADNRRLRQDDADEARAVRALEAVRELLGQALDKQANVYTSRDAAWAELKRLRAVSVQTNWDRGWF